MLRISGLKTFQSSFSPPRVCFSGAETNSLPLLEEFVFQEKNNLNVSLYAGLSPHIQEALSCMMNPDPQSRYPTCVAFVEALRQEGEKWDQPKHVEQYEAILVRCLEDSFLSEEENQYLEEARTRLHISSALHSELLSQALPLSSSDIQLLLSQRTVDRFAKDGQALLKISLRNRGEKTFHKIRILYHFFDTQPYKIFRKKI